MTTIAYRNIGNIIIKNIGIAGLLICCFQLSLAQRIDNSLRVNLHVAAIEGSSPRITEKRAGKIITFTTFGGHLKLSLSKFEDKDSKKWIARAYFHETEGTEQSNPISGVNFDHDRSVYIGSGKEMFIDIINPDKDTLVRRFIIKRPRLFPVVNFYHKERDSTVSFYSLKAGYDNKLSMTPGTLDLRTFERLDREGLTVEYLLINDKTKKQQRGSSVSGFVTFELKASTVYRLKVYYKDQTENVTEALLYVKPHWYKTTAAYLTLMVIFGVAVIVAITKVLRGRLRSSNKARQKLEQAALKLRSLFNPHFTFNALSTIQGLINTDRIEEANYYLEEFGSLLRATLAKSNDVFNSLDQELDMMRTYIRLEALRFNFQWEILVSDNLEASLIEIPTLLLQPLVENAIKHGLSSQAEQGRLLITCDEGDQPECFKIVINDNGVWKNGQDGYGLRLTKDLIQAVNALKREGRIDITFNRKSGTEVILTFYNWINK